MKTLFALAVVILLSACDNKNLDTPTSGHITIAVDETFQPVIDSEIDVFHALYKHATITPLYVPEAQALKMFMQDSVNLIIVARKLTPDELQYFESKKLFPDSDSVAHDAIAFITHPDNPDTALTLQQLRSIFQGADSTWQQLQPGNRLGALSIVFDNAKSSTARYVIENISPTLPSYCYEAGSNSAVVDYVADHPNAMGVIGVNWISDSDDSTTIDFLSRINVMRIAQDSLALPGKQPYQAYIALKSYPLTREIWMINSEGRSGLGTGFTSFVASDKGQTIILKAGLLPAQAPVRILDFEN